MSRGGTARCMAPEGQRFLDIHAHHYPAAYLDACRRRESGFEHYYRSDGRLVILQDGAVALAAPQPLPTLEGRLEAMEASGIQTQVLSLSAPNLYRFPQVLRRDLAVIVNDELAAMAARSRGRLKVFASLPLPDLESSLAELNRVLSIEGVVGIFLCTTIDRITLDDPQFAPLLAELSRRRCAVFVHGSTPCCTEGVREYAISLALDYMAEVTNAVARLVYSGSISRYPGIRWIFSHVGGTTPFLIHRFDNYHQQFPECRARESQLPSHVLKSVFFDTVTTHAPALRCALQTFPATQFLFGTDYPHVPGGMTRFVSTLESLGLTAWETSRIAWANAADLLGID